MPMPLAGETVCGKRKDREELGLYFPVLTTSPACPQSGDNYISNAEFKNTSIKSVYMEKGRVEPNLGWMGTPYDWSNGVTEVQSVFVDSGEMETETGVPNLLQNSSFPTLNSERWRFVYEDYDIGEKADNMLINTRFLDDGYPWVYWGNKLPNMKSFSKPTTFETPPGGTNLKTGIETKKDIGEVVLNTGYEQKGIPVSPGSEYTIGAWVKKKMHVLPKEGKNLLINTRNLPIDGTDHANNLEKSYNPDTGISRVELRGKTNVWNIHTWLNRRLSEPITEEIGGKYVISLDVRVQGMNDDVIFRPNLRNPMSTGEGVRIKKNTVGWHRYSSVIEIKDKRATSILLLLMGDGNNLKEGTVEMKNIKLELGTKATPWTPAPQDFPTPPFEGNLHLSMNLGSEEKGYQNKRINATNFEFGEWTRVYHTFKAREREFKANLKIGIASGDYGHFDIAGISMNKGRVPQPWSPSPSDSVEVSTHPSNWIYSKEAPKDKTRIWADTKDPLDMIPKKWTGTKWEELYLLNKAQHGGNVTIIKQATGNSAQIQKTGNGLVGLSQTVSVKEGVRPLEYVNASFDLEEKSMSKGMIVRIEFYDEDMNYLYSDISKTYHNIMVGKRRFDTEGLIQFRPVEDKIAKYIKVTFAGSQEDGRVNLAANKFKLEIGNRTTGWSLNAKEVGFNLDAGQLKTPKVEGQVDRGKVIKEVAILRSALGENLLSWEEVTRIQATSLKGAVLHDYFVENGGYYRYALQPIMLDGSKGSITGFYDVVSTLEGFWMLGQDDMQFSFIYDGKIDNIQYNKPSSFIETIASQYPYAVRSSETDYRSFSFSGKLTYQQDTQKLLTSNTYTQAVSPQSTNPIGFVELKYGDEKLLECQNDLAEMQNGMVMQRIWRHKLLDWMGDFKPKILKSEAEGNMLVMISNIQVNPVHTVYGLVADFSCQMIEIGKVDEETLKKFKLRKREITHNDLRKSLLNEVYSPF